MRLSFALVLLVPSLAAAQITAEQKKETARWVLALEVPGGGFSAAPQDPSAGAAPRPSLRATSSAVRALKYLGADVPNTDKHAAFVLTCYDPKTGAFAEPGGKPDVTITSIGVMAAVEVGVPKEKFAKAMDYLKGHAKTFEEVRIAAAAVEAWGVKDCPFKLDDWFAVGMKYGEGTASSPQDGGARDTGSLVALFLRLGRDLPPNNVKSIFADGQRADGGWGKQGAKASDIETTYRVMRALMLLKEPPKDVKKLREFIAAHRNKDGGYATAPGDKSSIGGVYYSVVVSKWLDGMEGAKK
ncbi:terpene cyclase/mutase family protein [Gemmata sp. JC673]|uniref:Geranylgeranyl transferase type II subunit beta n=1 Tax=Gemmata algarum TaxID=2975278 RepID=A0ABU5F3L7_9BACT|nr:prenyltransferase/squalene oxidase repeat-containing protein [Gemmata algarum]MDY3561402.1 terpene cyclase/mutase family protein [Gemmata algarum]